MKAKFLIALYVLSTIMIVNCCDKFWKEDEELTLKKVPYLGNLLRLDGYYYKNYLTNHTTFKVLYFFYRNGTILYVGGGYSESEIPDLEEQLKNGQFYSLAKTNKLSWGVFKIEGNKIEFEKWYPEKPFKVKISSGEILNDTTFTITKFMKPDSTDVTIKNDTFHFKQFYPKPDSTNNYVK